MHDRFATTRWSMVMHMASTESTGADRALTELAQRYWYPVYAYVRRCGHAPPIAQDIARSFLKCLMAQFRDGRLKAPQGLFRRFLLDQLNCFLAGDWRDMIDSEGTADIEPPADLEARNQRDNVAANSPEAAYEHSFALEVLARALRRLESEARQTGRLEMFQALRPHLGRDPPAGEYPLIAQQLDCSPLTLAVALKRLRQRFRELAGQELADTVTSAEDLSREQAALHAALRGLRTAP